MNDDRVSQTLFACELALAETPTLTRQTEAAETAANPPWVLCIDDDPTFLFALRTQLEARGVSVVCATAGMEGYLNAILYPARAIILDYCLPGGRGDYILRRLKENPATKDIPVIVITGTSDGNVERTMRNLGAVAYFHKSVAFSELLNEVLLQVTRRDSMSKPQNVETGSPTGMDQENVQTAVSQLLRDYSPLLEADHREAAGKPFFAPVSIGFVDEAFAELTAFSHAISTRGTSLLHIVPLTPGKVIVTFSRPTGGSLSLQTQLIVCQPFVKGWYKSGHRFLGVVKA